jgi:SAM-dependent methyltransferase
VGARERWNERYAGGELEPFPDAPAEWLVAHHDLLTGGGRALDVACGDGRNALYLAQLGYMVDAIDVSDVVIGALREAVQQRGLAMTIAPRVVDLERGPLPAGPYDVVVMLNYLQRDLFGPLAEALAPGGLALCETFAQSHVDQLGHRFNPEYLLATGELLRAFPQLEIVDHHEGVVVRSGARRGVAGIVARRPLPESGA